MLGFARFRRGGSTKEALFRDELLSIERLEEGARALAARFTLAPPRRLSSGAFPRLQENARVLRTVYRELADDVHRGEFVTAAAEWLLDNFPLVDAEIQRIRRNLPTAAFRIAWRFGRSRPGSFPLLRGARQRLLTSPECSGGMDPE